MLINWFTVFAQIINFLVLVFLLKRFLYGPIIAAMDKRAQNIASRLKEAAQKSAEAEKEHESYQKRIEDFESRRSAMLASVRDETEEKKKELLDEARHEVEGLRERWKEAVTRERDSLLRILETKTAEQVHRFMRQALRELADEDLERHIARVFLSRLRAMKGAERQRFLETLTGDKEKLTVRSSYPLKEEEKSAVLDQVRDILGKNREVEFTLSPDILCGIELSTTGYVIGWNLEEYVKSIEEEFLTTLAGRGMKQPGTAG